MFSGCAHSMWKRDIVSSGRIHTWTQNLYDVCQVKDEEIVWLYDMGDMGDMGGEKSK